MTGSRVTKNISNSVTGSVIENYSKDSNHVEYFEWRLALEARHGSFCRAADCQPSHMYAAGEPAGPRESTLAGANNLLSLSQRVRSRLSNSIRSERSLRRAQVQQRTI